LNVKVIKHLRKLWILGYSYKPEYEDFLLEEWMESLDLWILRYYFCLPSWTGSSCMHHVYFVTIDCDHACYLFLSHD